MRRIFNHIKTKVVFIIMALFCAISFVGYSAFIFTNKYNGAGFTSNNPVVAYLVEKSSGAKVKDCTTLEDAMYSARSGQVIEVIPGTNPVITGRWTMKNGEKVLDLNYTTIKEGVTLNIPYALSGIRGVANTTTAASDGIPNKNSFATSTPSLLKNTVTISSNVQIINNGLIEIGGQLSGGAGGSRQSGHTAGSYSRIVMRSNSSIICGHEVGNVSGNIKCFGYIMESKINNGSFIDIKVGSIGTPFIVRDFRGGSDSVSINNANTGAADAKCSPFNQYEVRNVEPKLIIHYGSSLKGYCNLYAGKRDNGTVGDIIGNTSSCLIQLSKDSIFVSKYYKTDYTDPVTKESFPAEGCKIDIYGGGTMNALSLDINVIINVHISTGAVFFPLTWRHYINLHAREGQNNAVFNIPNPIKLLPGAKLFVDNNATLKAPNLTILKYSTDTDPLTRSGFNDLSVVGMGGTKYIEPTTYPTSDDDAELRIRGTLDAGNIGGLISAEPGGLIAVTTASITTKEIYQTYYHKLPFLIKAADPYSILNQLTGLQKDDATAVPEPLNAGSYLGSLGTNNNYWIINNIQFKINYNVMYEERDSSISRVEKYNDASMPLESNTNKNININNLSNNGGYKFIHWYFDDNFNNPIRDGVLKGTEAYRYIVESESNPNEYIVNLYGRYTAKDIIQLVYKESPLRKGDVVPTLIQDAVVGDDYELPDSRTIKWPYSTTKSSTNLDMKFSQYYFNRWAILDANGNEIPGYESAVRSFIVPSGHPVITIQPILDVEELFKFYVTGANKDNDHLTYYLNEEDISEQVKHRDGIGAQNYDVWLPVGVTFKLVVTTGPGYQAHAKVTFSDMNDSALYDTHGNKIKVINSRYNAGTIVFKMPSTGVHLNAGIG